MNKHYTTSDFDYTLPPELVAHSPVHPRESARLLHWPMTAGEQHFTFANLPNLLNPGDLLVFNNTKVIPARLFGSRPRNQQEGEVRVEFLLHRPLEQLNTWQVFARPAKRLSAGQIYKFSPKISAQVIDRDGERAALRFNCPADDFYALLEDIGEMPLPPYITRDQGATKADESDYQTIFAKHKGSVAAPTASLHFSEKLMDALAARGINHTFLTLHVGAGTFLPVKTEHIKQHTMHAEWGRISEESAAVIAQTRQQGGRVIAVGTTALRLLETAAQNGSIEAWEGWTDIFITPGFRFKAADMLITNFHLPKSTLMMLVAAFIGFDEMKALYAHALKEQYRFYSYGDGSLLTRKS